MLVTTAILTGLALAFANGANDNSKGVATLVGSRAMELGKALRYAAVTTLLGSFAAILLAQTLVDRFGGKGIVADDLARLPAFAASVGIAASLTVLLATRLAMPISTTHSLVGSIVGIGLAAGALDAPTVVKVFLIPLLVSPAIALGLAAVAYSVARATRRRLGVTRETCVCLDRSFEPVAIGADGAIMLRSTGAVLDVANREQCVERYSGQVVGLDAQRILDVCHLLTAGAVSFARGLNDTPKIAAVMVAAGALGSAHPAVALVATGIFIAAGGLLMVRRVAETMSERITEMNDGQAFTANLVTAFLVIFASKLGVPVSTTHVSCGSLFGIGAVSGKGHWSTIATIVLAWVTTLPVAGLIGVLAWTVLS
ncbi:MAG: inorganic phosphate transporter [Acidobacteria bacterium]|nr:inorganic phosphate transporter [Acidobacteriota bacterium]